MNPCRFCGSTDCYMQFDTIHYRVACPGCGAYGPQADWQRDAEAYWDGTSMPNRVARPNEYIG